MCDPGQTCARTKSFATYCNVVYGPGYGFAAVKFDVNLDGIDLLPLPKREVVE